MPVPQTIQLRDRWSHHRTITIDDFLRLRAQGSLSWIFPDAPESWPDSYGDTPVYRPVKSIRELKPTCIVRHKQDADSVIITANYADRAIGVRTFDITNPEEWEIYVPSINPNIHPD